MPNHLTKKPLGIIDKLFFSETRYSLGEVGRYRINKKLNIQDDPDDIVLRSQILF